MSHTDPSEIQPRAERQGIVAVLACFACCAYLFNVAAPTVAWLHAWWAGWAVYAILPLALTFTLLHGSRIHREKTEAARDVFLFLTTLAIFIGVILFMAVSVLFASVVTGFARIGP